MQSFSRRLVAHKPVHVGPALATALVAFAVLAGGPLAEEKADTTLTACSS